MSSGWVSFVPWSAEEVALVVEVPETDKDTEEVSGGIVGELELPQPSDSESTITTTTASSSQSILLFLESFGRGEHVIGSMTSGTGCECNTPAAGDIAKQKLELGFGN